MATKCSNCKATLSCGCQRRTASNGVSVCTNCLANYEKSLKKSTESSNSIDPTGVHVVQNGRWVKLDNPN
jgi:hypothetical protein